MRTAKIGPDLRLPMCPPAGVKKIAHFCSDRTQYRAYGLVNRLLYQTLKMHGKIEVFILRCSRIFCQWESGYGSSFVYAHKKSQGIFSFFLRVSFQFFALMLCILLMPAEFIQLKYNDSLAKSVPGFQIVPLASCFNFHVTSFCVFPTIQGDLELQFTAIKSMWSIPSPIPSPFRGSLVYPGWGNRKKQEEYWKF